MIHLENAPDLASQFGVWAPLVSFAVALLKGVAIPNPAPGAGATMNGVDVSHHNGARILTKIPYDFAVIKASEGTSFVDPQAKQNVADARAAGEPWGLYHFTNAHIG